MEALEKQDLDKLIIELVPKEVEINPGVFEDRENGFQYCTQKAWAFLSKLFPKDQRVKLRAEVLNKERLAIFWLYDVVPQFQLMCRPAFPMISCSEDGKLKYWEAHVFDLAFKPGNESETRNILQVSFGDFFLHQRDLAEGNPAVFGIKGIGVAKEGLDLLAYYLPKGTKLNAVCNYGVNFGKVEYEI